MMKVFFVPRNIFLEPERMGRQQDAIFQSVVLIQDNTCGMGYIESEAGPR